MLKQKDAEGKYPLSGNEYYAIREIFGVISAYESSMNYLKDRAKLTPGVWRDLCLVLKKSQTALDDLLRTVPRKKLQQMKVDIENTVVSIEVRAPHSVKPKKAPDFACVPITALDNLIGRVMDIDCFACEKSEREIKKCPMKVLIEDTFAYEIPDPEDGRCKFCNFHIDHDDRRYEEGEQNHA